MMLFIITFLQWDRQVLRRTLLLLTCLLAGCGGLRTNLPATPRLPANWLNAPAATAQQYGFAMRQDNFWRTLGDPILPDLLARAFQQNDDLKLSELQMKLAGLQASFAALSRWPDVSLSANASLARPLSSVEGWKPVTHRSAGLGATLSQTLDIWGAQSAQREAADIDAQASEFDWQTARLALSVSVAQARFQIGYLNQLIFHAQADLNDAENTLALVQARYQAGASPWADVVFAQRSLAIQKSNLAQSQQQRTEARYRFAILMGETPERYYSELGDLSDTALPVPQPGLPADLLSRRPDVRAAELRLRSSLASGDAARLSFYPSLTLTAQHGTSSATLTDYLNNPVASMAASLSLPFVQFNTARLTGQRTKLANEIANVNFKKTLYGALQQVENALSVRERFIEQAQYLVDIVAQSREAERLTQVRWQQGSTDIQPWLDAKRARRQAELNLSQNTLARKNNAIDLYAALGGDYQQQAK